MNYSEAIELRNSNFDLIGQPMHNEPNGWDIKDIIVSNGNPGEIYEIMWQNDLPNEQALSLSKAVSEDYKVYIISHQWPWGSGNLLFKDLEKYAR